MTLGAAFLFVGLGLGMGTALAATGAAALLVREATASASAPDLARSELALFPAPPLAFADDAREGNHDDVVERTPSRASERAEAAAEAQLRTHARRRATPDGAMLVARATAETSTTLSALLNADARAALEGARAVPASR